MARQSWVERLGKKILITVDILFLIVGCAFVVLVGVYWNKLNELRTQADVLQELNLDTIINVVFFAAILSIVAAIVGLVAVFKDFKKLLLFYVILVCMAFLVQLSMGILMLTLSPDSVHDSFREDSVTGDERRTQFQEYMKCCGWDYISEEFFPTRIACFSLNPDYTTSCKDATKDLLDTWVSPMAIALVCIGCFSFIALVASLMVIFSSRGTKEDFFDNPFSF